MRALRLEKTLTDETARSAYRESNETTNECKIERVERKQ